MDDPQSLPLYLQLADTLLRAIASGRLVEGERLRPEREMAAAHGVSVGTLRKSLAELTARGHLERRQGSGNYVRRTREAGGIYAFFRLELVAGGGQPTAEGLAVDLVAKPEAAPDFGPAPRAWRMRRRRSLGGIVAAAEEVYIDAGRATAIERADLDGSLYHLYATRLGLRITRIEDRIGVAPIPEWGRPMTPGAVGGFVERVSWDQHGARAEYSRTWFDAEVARYVARQT